MSVQEAWWRWHAISQWPVSLSAWRLHTISAISMHIMKQLNLVVFPPVRPFCSFGEIVNVLQYWRHISRQKWSLQSCIADCLSSSATLLLLASCLTSRGSSPYHLASAMGFWLNNHLRKISEALCLIFSWNFQLCICDYSFRIAWTGMHQSGWLLIN